MSRIFIVSEVLEETTAQLGKFFFVPKSTKSRMKKFGNGDIILIKTKWHK